MFKLLPTIFLGKKLEILQTFQRLINPSNQLNEGKRKTGHLSGSYKKQLESILSVGEFGDMSCVELLSVNMESSNKTILVDYATGCDDLDKVQSVGVILNQNAEHIRYRLAQHNAHMTVRSLFFRHCGEPPRQKMMEQTSEEVYGLPRARYLTQLRVGPTLTVASSAPAAAPVTHFFGHKRARVSLDRGKKILHRNVDPRDVEDCD